MSSKIPSIFGRRKYESLCDDYVTAKTVNIWRHWRIWKILFVTTLEPDSSSLTHFCTLYYSSFSHYICSGYFEFIRRQKNYISNEAFRCGLYRAR